MPALHQEAQIQTRRAAADTDYAHDPSLSRAAPFAESSSHIILSIKYFLEQPVVKMDVVEPRRGPPSAHRSAGNRQIRHLSKPVRRHSATT
jgi:hypothetical protein